MAEKRDNKPFYRWVPRPAGIIVLLLMFIPPTFSGGAYLSNIGEMTGGLGVWNEDIQLAAFFTSIGMCLFVPFLVPFLQARRIRQTYLWCFGTLAVLNIVCAETTSLPVLCGTCLVIGFVRIIVMLNCTFTIAPYLTGVNTLNMFTMTETPSPEVQYRMERMRTFLMPVLYFYILLIAQGSNVVTSWFAYNYHWQASYYATDAMLLMAMLLVVLLMPNENRPYSYKIEWIKVPDLLLMTVALCCMAYVLIYGKTLDWFDSLSITVCFGVMLITLGLFLWRSIKMGDRHYLPLRSFGYRNMLMALAIFVISIIFNSANSFVGSFTKLTTSADNYHAASLSAWAILGCFIGLVIALLLVVRRVRFRTTFCLAFLLMASANAYMYFQYQTEGVWSNMAIPMVLNFAGLLMLYSLTAAFSMKVLPAKYLVAAVFIMIWSRNSVAPIIGSSIYSNWLNQKQQDYVERLSQDVNAENVYASASYDGTRIVGQLSGKGTYEASQLASTAIKGRVAKQSAILAMKDITGTTTVLLLISAGIVLFLPYRKGETT